jgi:hypothetical protein
MDLSEFHEIAELNHGLGVYPQLWAWLAWKHRNKRFLTAPEQKVMHSALKRSVKFVNRTE